MRNLSPLPIPVPSPVAAFAGRKVLVVGDLVADEYVFGEADRISREAPVLVVRWESSEVALGGAGNAAVNLAALGATVRILGHVGQDEAGRSLRKLLRQSRIELIAPRAPGLATESKTRIMAGGVGTRRQQVLRLDRAGRAAGAPFPAPMVQELVDHLGMLARDVDAILVSDYGGGVLAPEMVRATVQAARLCPVCVDSRYNLAAFAGATVLKPNEPEFESLTGLRPEDDQLNRALTVARKRAPGSDFVITRGRNGMLVVQKNRLDRLAPHGPREAVDVTGAGDTVGATLTLGLAAGMPLVEAARLANVAGGLKVQKLGTVPVHADELTRALAGERSRTP